MLISFVDMAKMNMLECINHNLSIIRVLNFVYSPSNRAVLPFLSVEFALAPLFNESNTSLDSPFLTAKI